MGKRALFYVVTLTVIFSKGLGSLQIEPKCSKFDFEERLLEKMVRMEHSVELMDDKIDVLAKKVLAEKQSVGTFQQKTNSALGRLERLIEGNLS